MKANIKNLTQAQGRCPEVAGRSGDFLQHNLLVGNCRIKFNDLFTGRHINLFGFGNDLPCSFPGISLFFCIYLFDNCNIFPSKRSPCVVAGSSTLAHIRPV